jgi:hypothetical protein
VAGRSVVSDPIDPNLVRHAVIALSAYLRQAAGRGDRELIGNYFGAGLVNGSQNGSGRKSMSIGEALEVLGLEPSASPHEIREAHRRLEQKLNPEFGGTHYLTAKISQARDVLLGE